MPTYTKRVVINRGKVERIRLILADGLFNLGQHIIDVADPPDAPPVGVGLVEGGGVIAYVDGKKVAGTQIGGREIKKPRAVRLPRPGIIAIVGYGFPGRLVHNGSINNIANPFLARAAFDIILPDAAALMRGFCRPRIARIR